MKRLVCLCDGTWNRPDREAEISNVVKLQRAIPSVDAHGVRQLVHYEIGIATGVPEHVRFIVGAIGFGVGDRMRNAYRFVVENYEPGDEVYLIGLSRGAFEARSVAGLIALLGVARSPAPETIAGFWECYEDDKLRDDPARLEECRGASIYPVRIRCVAVWDTVGTLGLPLLNRSLFKELLGFKDTELSSLVDIGLQALAIDEPRAHFSPTLWTAAKGAALPPGQLIEQVWFPGSHLDICGGTESSALSDGALLWMAQRLRETTDLAIDLDHLRAAHRPDPLGPQLEPTSDSVHRVSHVFPFVRLIRQNRNGVSLLRRLVFGNWRVGVLPPDRQPVNESIHPSALARFGRRVSIRRGASVREREYRPRNLAAALAGQPPSLPLQAGMAVSTSRAQ